MKKSGKGDPSFYILENDETGEFYTFKDKEICAKVGKILTKRKPLTKDDRIILEMCEIRSRIKDEERLED